MPDFLISARRVKNAEFTAEPGPVRFLKVPSNRLPKPSHAISRASWVDRVLKDAHSNVDEHNSDDCGNVLVYVHGYNNNGKSLMWRHRRLQTDLSTKGYTGSVVSFDWPSDDRSLNYLEDRFDAKRTALHLVDNGIRLFSSAQYRGCDTNVHLLAHSAGAYVIREAFDDADDCPSIAGVNWTVSQICFIAADVSRQSMSASDSRSRSLYRHCVRLTNYQSPFDSVLKLSNIKRVGVAPRVGRVGMPNDAPHNAVNVNCGDYFSDKSENDSAFIGRFNHSWHIGDERFAEDLVYTLKGDIDRKVIPTRSVTNGHLSLR